MPFWLEEIMARVTLSNLNSNNRPGVIRAALRRTLARERQPNQTDRELNNLIRRVRRRKELAERLTESGERTPRPQNVPRCAELASGEPSYHATVYITFSTPEGKLCGRIPVHLSFDEPSSAQEIIDLAIENATEGISSGSPTSGGVSGDPSSRRCEAEEDTAVLGQVCYG